MFGKWCRIIRSFRAVKAILAEREGTPDWLHIRPPLERLGADASAALIDALKKLEN